MNLNFFGRVFLLVFVVAIFISCAQKIVLTDGTLGAQAVFDYAQKNTPVFCAYKGRIAITVDSGEHKFSFSSLLDKQCSGDFKLTVLGAFNRPMFVLESVNGEINAESSDPEMQQTLLTIGREYADVLSILLRSPLKLPDSPFTLKTGDSVYELSYPSGTKVIINDRFFIIGYVYGNASNTYEWKGRSIASITAEGEGRGLTVRFLNADGWR